ncbi:unnamed protein product [Phytomonas sp. Hart1]|nr:unnamed protein product [Phytomonas sp. Hart1]|eukprot:CCW66983.1 unnamed protein product [Phytomonas sp. isolate Hart1]
MTINVANCIAFERACEAYNKGITHLLNGEFEPCILALQECIFFSHNRNANAMVALGECYVMACDLASAVRWYRRALWVLQGSTSFATEPQELASALTDHSAQLLIPSITNGANLATQEPVPAVDAGPMTSVSPDVVNHEDVGCGEAQLVNQGASPATQESMAELTTSMEKEPWAPGVRKSQVKTRLAGLLDALSLVHYRMGDFAQALRFAEQSLAILPNQPLVCLHWCMYLIVMQRQDEAERKLENYLKEIQKSAKDATTSSFSPLRVPIAALLSHLCCGRQSFKAARTLLDEELKGCGSGVKVESESGCMEKGVNKAHLAIVAKQQFQDTYIDYRTKALARQDIGTISRCINVFPDSVDLLFSRAQIYIRTGQLKRSIRDLFRCIRESNGTHSQAIEMMTSVLFTIGQTSLADDQSDTDPSTGGGGNQSKSNLDEAIVYYTESLKWRTDNTLVLLARGDCYSKKEDYVHALEDYKKVLDLEDKLGGEISPLASSANGRIASLHNLWACKLYSAGSFKEAEVEFSNAIKADSQQPAFFFHRAMCRFRLEEPSYALRDVLSCHELKPTDPMLRAFVTRYLGSEDVSYLLPPLAGFSARIHPKVSNGTLALNGSAVRVETQSPIEDMILGETERKDQYNQRVSSSLKRTAFLPPVSMSNFSQAKYLEAWRHYCQLSRIDPITPGPFKKKGDVGNQMRGKGVVLKGKQMKLRSKYNRGL